MGRICRYSALEHEARLYGHIQVINLKTKQEKIMNITKMLVIAGAAGAASISAADVTPVVSGVTLTQPRYEIDDHNLFSVGASRGHA